MTDIITPWAIRVAATLRVADLITDGVTGLDALAKRADADPDALRRLLRYLTCRGIFSEPEPDTFEMTEAAKGLLDSAGMRVWLDLDGMAGRLERAFVGLLDAVRTGKPAYPELYGSPVFDDFAAHPDLAVAFGSLMASKSSWFAPDIVDIYDWAGVRHVVDVGGGFGVLLSHVLRAHNSIRGTVVDTPGTVAATQDALVAAGLGDRCEVVTSSFFEPLPAGGDVYVLWNILHDWADEQAVLILRRCAEAAGQTGRVLIIELDEHAPQMSTDMDLRMLVYLGGRERTAQQFERLAADAGMTVTSVQRTPSGLALIKCRHTDREQSVTEC